MLNFECADQVAILNNDNQIVEYGVVIPKNYIYLFKNTNPNINPVGIGTKNTHDTKSKTKFVLTRDKIMFPHMTYEGIGKFYIQPIECASLCKENSSTSISILSTFENEFKLIFKGESNKKTLGIGSICIYEKSNAIILDTSYTPDLIRTNITRYISPFTNTYMRLINKKYIPADNVRYILQCEFLHKPIEENGFLISTHILNIYITYVDIADLTPGQIGLETPLAKLVYDKYLEQCNKETEAINEETTNVSTSNTKQE